MCGTPCGGIVHGAAGIAQAIVGIDRPDDDTIKARRRLCILCEHAQPCLGFIGRKCQCAKCGCAIRAKTALAAEECPVGLWGKSIAIQ